MESLRRWVQQAVIDAGDQRGASSGEKGIEQLEPENRELREANEILKAASVFFAGELDLRRR